jgi:hypothetical protein
MTPGRSLDALICEKIMGWKRLGQNDHTKPRHRLSKIDPGQMFSDWSEKGPHDYLLSPCGGNIIYFCECDDVGDLPSFSNDIQEAWKILDKMHSLGISWWIEQGENSKFPTVYIENPSPKESCINFLEDMEKISEMSESVSHAICLAALKVIEIKDIQK